MNPALKYLLEDPATLELMRELSSEELKTIEVTEREFDLGGEHIVRVNGENFFSFEAWCGRIKSVKRLRARPATAPKPTGKKWEYKIMSGVSPKEMIALGEDGWELVAVTPQNDKEYKTLYFKREKL